MSADLCSCQSFYRRTEKQTVSYCSRTTHSLISCFIAGSCCVVFCEGKGETPTGHRRELFILIDDTHYRVRKYCTLHTVDHDCSDSHLSGIRLITRFTVDQISQKISVSLCKGDL